MIRALRGQVVVISPGEVVLDVRGVGYGVRTPLSTYYELERLGGDESEVRLLISTQVREDAIELFGFLTELERELFEMLLGVTGIGPRLAQGILSGIPPVEVLRSIADADAVRLTRIPGVGKKTAERLVLELRERAARMAQEARLTEPSRDTSADLVEALVNLGYRGTEAEKAVARVSDDNPDAELSELLRMALRTLSRVS